MDWHTYRCARQLIRAEQRRLPALRIVEVGSYVVTTPYSRLRRVLLRVPDHHRTLLRPTDTLLGCDAVPGPGVDLVADGAYLPLPDQVADVALASSVLEHAIAPVAILRELLRVATKAIVIVPWRYYYHARSCHYEDYWRVSPAGLAVWTAQAGGRTLRAGWAGPHTWAVIATCVGQRTAI